MMQTIGRPDEVRANCPKPTVLREIPFYDSSPTSPKTFMIAPRTRFSTSGGPSGLIPPISQSVSGLANKPPHPTPSTVSAHPWYRFTLLYRYPLLTIDRPVTATHMPRVCPAGPEAAVPLGGRSAAVRFRGAKKGAVNSDQLRAPGLDLLASASLTSTPRPRALRSAMAGSAPGPGSDAAHFTSGSKRKRIPSRGSDTARSKRQAPAPKSPAKPPAKKTTPKKLVQPKPTHKKDNKLERLPRSVLN